MVLEVGLDFDVQLDLAIVAARDLVYQALELRGEGGGLRGYRAHC